MRVFMDTEFTGLRQQTTLISIGFVDEHRNTFYAEFTDYDRGQVDSWIEENVIANLTLDGTSNNIITNSDDKVEVVGDSKYMTKLLTSWLNARGSAGDQIHIWADCLAYDWVLFCNLYGNATNIPSSVYYIPFDIATVLREKGRDPDVNRETFCNIKKSTGKHNALHDALITKKMYDELHWLANAMEYINTLMWE